MILFKSKRAFTLVETLVVIGIISMIIGLLAPKGEKFLDNIKKVIAKHAIINKIKKRKLDAFLMDENDRNFSIFKIESTH